MLLAGGNRKPYRQSCGHNDKTQRPGTDGCTSNVPPSQRPEKSRNQQTKDDHPHGEQTVKDLIGQNQGVTSIPLDDIRIRDFSQAARKYGVDFAVTKDKTITPPRYVVFFKARDTDALKQILGELTQKQLNQKERPSLIKQLAKIKNMVKAIPSKARRHEQEHDR